jgi:hypothetical protein
MADVVARRYFDHGGVRSAKALFASAAAWPAFTRLIDYVDQMFVQDFGPSGTWPDAVSIRHREIWRGDMDHEMVQFCAVAGAHLDSNPHLMTGRIKAELPCVSRLIKSMEETREMAKATVAAGSVASVGSEEKNDAEEGGPTTAGASSAADGVISNAIDGFGDMSAAERRQLAAELTKRSADDRNKAMDRELSYQAAAIIRARVIIVKKVEQACTPHVGLEKTVGSAQGEGVAHSPPRVG